MPALLPDGTPAQDSVSPFITHRIEPPALGSESRPGAGGSGGSPPGMQSGGSPPRDGTAGGRVLTDEQRTLLGSGSQEGDQE
jgi:hypothetical protein